MTQEKIEALINNCIARIEADNVAGIVSVARDTNNTITNSTYLNIIAAKLTESGKYIKEWRDGDWWVHKNPAYELTLSVIDTNNSVKNLNDIVIPRQFRIQKN